MSERPHVICLMTSSVDGGLHPSRFTASPDGAVEDWNGLYEELHGRLAGDAWIVGRVTMAEMAKDEPHAPADARAPERPHHFARRGAGPYAIALDGKGRLHFGGPQVGGDPVVVLLGSEVDDRHLAELAEDGVSYVVSEGPEVDVPQALAVLRRELGIERLLLEGGAGINGGFLAQGLVDELHVVITPALDGRADAESIVAHGADGLAGRVQLSLRDCARLSHGAVHLSYAVLPA